MLGIATRCLSVSTEGELREVISHLANLVTFDKAALCAVKPAEGGMAITHLINHSFGKAWESVYAGQGFHRVDPILKFQPKDSPVFDWHEAIEVENRSVNRDFFAAAREFSLVGGMAFTCAFRNTPSYRSVLSLSGIPVRESARTSEILGSIGPHIHEAYGRIVDQSFQSLAGVPTRDVARGTGDGQRMSSGSPFSTTEPLGSATLSEREREVLCWVQQGKTYWEISQIIGISERTVKYHLARIKSRLDVVSPCHAVAKALRMGLIS
ncbi:MAG: LuxR C-terminal-related transcriptional regulator [Polyangiaceae bacterium]